MKAKILPVLALSACLLLAGCGDAGDSTESIEESTSESTEVSLETLWIQYDTITIAEALDICAGLATGATASEQYYIKGTIDEISNANYGSMTISDDTGEIYVYGVYGENGEYFNTLENIPTEGDYILLYSTLQNYNGTYEISRGVLIDYYENDNFDESLYTEMTIAEAREEAAGSMVRVKGTVVQYTYGSSASTKSGFLLADSESQASIAVYDQMAAIQVEIGNNIEICGTRANYISSSETSAAAALGYTGAIQLSDATIVENDGSTDPVDLSWVETKTMREILATEPTDNISATIYNATAIINRSAGGSYVNYYIDDLDGYTGTYCYSNCDGDDYAWLDPYDGYVCDVYFAVLNGSSRSTGITWRLLPISAEIIEGYVLDDDLSAQFVIDYYAYDQFSDTYMSDPAMEVITSQASPNEYVNIDNVVISYSSSDESLAWFAEEDGATVFHTSEEKTGEVTITITATNGSYASATATKTIAVEDAPDYEDDAITVAEAIAGASESNNVIVKGVVGPSLVNQTGFYLIDETGAIAVRMNDMSDAQIGNTVYVQGDCIYYSNNSSPSYYQICITSGELLLNMYGTTDYPTDSFKSATLDELINLDMSDATVTAQIYTLEHVTFALTDAMYPTYYVLPLDYADYDSDVSWSTIGIQLYSSSYNQYSFLEDYIDQDVSIEIGIVNFNSRSYARGCVLSVTDSEGNTVYNEYNF